MSVVNKVVAPPYHVQLTAENVRNGFPYFKHHDSISALWLDKWRMPCSKALYPFGDAKVEDFDPIFATLAKVTNNQTDILFQPDDYVKHFLPLAETRLEEASAAEAQGDESKASELYLRSAAIYRISRFPLNRSSLSESSWQLGKQTYIKGARFLDPPIVPQNIPFIYADAAAGDKAEDIQAFIRMPKGKAPEGGWPVLLFICGLDAYKTDNTSRTDVHVQHGFATILFEIPGTGDSPAAPSDPTSPDRLMSSVLDWVESNGAPYNFNLKQICARGISTGGYYAMRIAHTHADRLLAVVSQGGGAHHMFDPEWIGAQNQMEYPYALADALAYKFGFREASPVEAYSSGARKFSLLEAGIFDKPSCKLALVNGLEDSIFPIEDSVICGLSGRNKSLLLRANVGHMGNPGGEELVYQFLDEAIKASER